MDRIFLRLVLSVSWSIRLAISTGIRWEDWDRRQVCYPTEYLTPSHEAELVSAVQAANDAGEQVKVVGAGHSFSAIALTNGRMISLDRMKRVLHQEGTLVRVQAGIRLYELNAELERRGLSLENLGATCEQSLAGATATGTHGTGRLLGNLASRIESVRLVIANGSVVEASRKRHKDIFDAARVGLGSLGIVSELVIRALPLYRLRLTNTIMPLGRLLQGLPAAMEKYERLQWFWLPPDEERATLVAREVVDEPITPGGCWEGNLRNYHLAQPARMFGLPEANATTCVDVSYKALCDSAAHYKARKLYTEMEMFVPAEDVIAAINQFRAFQARVLPEHNASVSLFTGVRYVAADDILLSTARGRATAVISFIVMGPSTEEAGDPTEFARYAQELERLAVRDFQGRPHWGKMNWATHENIRAGYGEANVQKFNELRASLDPRGIFLNDYLRSRLGLNNYVVTYM
eukprot:TRINITY_DN31009_c0_g1_i1.p1 TRINITY_DN31009_c0_g1~~TRINITY_DN31009_c0_g1_i1.p1  ORF type:complete len:477 (+),score=59.98 TRINITY_DN31009_c0_g1_i1:43-1431(+)